MALAFRNINATPADAVGHWGVEGLATAMERGDVSHWRRIAAELSRRPHGEFAREVEEAIEVTGSESVSELFRSLLLDLRMSHAADDKAEVAARLHKFLEKSDLPRKDFAAELGTSTSRLSTYLSGKVTPSASIYIRAEKLAHDHQL